MKPSQELIDAIYRERILRARAMPPGERVCESLRLFEMGCEITKAGIRAQHPDADEEEVLRVLKDRLALARKLEQSELAEDRPTVTMDLLSGRQTEARFEGLPAENDPTRGQP